jgi:hypothetical protein
MARTTTVAVETRLLEQLRARHPGKDDRQLIEDLVRIRLGFEAIGESQRRNAVPEGEAIAMAVEAVHDVRREK